MISNVYIYKFLIGFSLTLLNFPCLSTTILKAASVTFLDTHVCDRYVTFKYCSAALLVHCYIRCCIEKTYI